MLTHKGTQTIETPRLLLRQALPEDAEAMYRNWASSPEVTKFLTWPPHRSVEDARARIAIWQAEYADPTSYQWMIVLKELGQPIGSICAREIDERIRSTEVGYCIGKDWWHRGIMTEALGAVIDFLFSRVGFNRVTSRHDPNNPHSGQVMQNCGMVLEGIAREGDWNNQGLCDAAYYAILRSQWEK